MAKLRKIRSMLNNLIESYFSCLNHYQAYWDSANRSGCPASWLWKIAATNNKWDLSIDILNKTCDPEIFAFEPILFPIEKFSSIISKCFADANIEIDFIKNIKFLIRIRKSEHLPIVICSAELIGANNKIYKSKEYTVEAYELHIGSQA